FLEDERLHGRGVTPAELGRVPGHHPAVVEEGGLPVPRPLRNPGFFRRPEVEPHPLLGRVGVEEDVELGSEGLLLRPPGKPHRAKGGTPVSTPLKSWSRTPSMESIVHCLSDVALLTACQPWASCTRPP